MTLKVRQWAHGGGPLTPLQWQGWQDMEPQLVLVFAAPEHFIAGELAGVLAQAFPKACLAGCSTAGEIVPGGAMTGAATVTALHFDHTQVRQAVTELSHMGDSRAAGMRLGEQLVGPELDAVLVFAQGVRVNGSAVVAGLADVLGDQLPIIGGLAGDGTAFRQTWVLSNQGPSTTHLVAVGLYGTALQLGYGAFGGWTPFGPARRVTRCAGNVLYELDGEPALEVYKRYLGEYAVDLPASALHFPLAMEGRNRECSGLIRSVLGVDGQQGSMILAGEIDPEGYLRLMHASRDALVDGAQWAAKSAATRLGVPPQLALLVSCVGRKVVMGSQTDEEVEAVADVVGHGVPLTGFYAYGEISPLDGANYGRLHNQTMTVSLWAER